LSSLRPTVQQLPSARGKRLLPEAVYNSIWGVDGGTVTGLPKLQKSSVGLV
jgi:hypothetical protein